MANIDFDAIDIHNQLKSQLGIVPGNKTGKKYLKPLVDKGLNRVNQTNASG